MSTLRDPDQGQEEVETPTEEPEEMPSEKVCTYLGVCLWVYLCMHDDGL